MQNYKDYENLARSLVDELYKKQNTGLLTSINKKEYANLKVTRKKILENLYEEMSQYVRADGKPMTDAEKKVVLELVRRDIWGYGVIDELIHDKDISDIKIYSYDNIRIKTQGTRTAGNIRFSDKFAYDTFVTRLLERNRINLGTANAIQTFTDATQSDFILRITAISGILTDSGEPCVAIRKIPKDKYSLETLEKMGMFDQMLNPTEENVPKKRGRKPKSETEITAILKKMITSRGILFTGKGASGKTTLMNALIAEIPEGDSVMICQENSELFDNNHPDILTTHVMVNGGDSKVSYTLGDLTRAALLFDLDRVIVGEVKEGNEAAGLSKASMTGHKCWTSVHGESCEMAVDKMADYISQATGYNTKEALKQLCGFEYVVHLRNFKVDEIVRIDGWDKKTESLKLVPAYKLEVKECEN